MQIRDAGADAHGPTAPDRPGRRFMENADRVAPNEPPAVQQAFAVECFWPPRSLR